MWLYWCLLSTIISGFTAVVFITTQEVISSNCMMIAYGTIVEDISNFSFLTHLIYKISISNIIFNIRLISNFEN